MCGFYYDINIFPQNFLKFLVIADSPSFYVHMTAMIANVFLFVLKAFGSSMAPVQFML